MQIGEIEVLPVVDGVGRYSAPTAYTRFSTMDGKGMDAADWDAHGEFLDDEGRLELAMGAYLVRSGDRLVLVDAGLGGEYVQSRSMEGGALLESLHGLGVDEDDITDVLFTHLHGDHIGWASNRGEIVFPNAVYRCHQLDWDHFFGVDQLVTDKLTPTMARTELFDHDCSIGPGIDVRLAPGHTPGSVLVVLSSGAARALLIGDVAHCPIELVDDEWAALADVDPVLALQTRTALARELEDGHTPVAAAHFPGLAFGRLLRGESRRRWLVS